MISAGLMFLQQMSCGVNFILATVPISEEIAGKNLDPHTVSLIIAITPLVTLGISALFIDRIGRRVLLICSCTLMALSSAALGFCFYVQAGEQDGVSEKLMWFRLIFFVAYIFSFSFGLGPISWLMMGEILPDRTRG